MKAIPTNAAGIITLKFSRIRSKVWEWAVLDGKRQIAGGYCKTKRDSVSDACHWMNREATAQIEALAASIGAAEYFK